MDLDNMIRKIAEKNGFIFNNDHNKDLVIGLPWIIDFRIDRKK